jgi:peptidoglycan hydrolase-like protein with peptidoglycan-binding domain
LAEIDNRPFRTINANYPNYAHYRELRFGDRGADVANLQRRLKHLGYFNTHPTGSFREITLHAVKYFQRINGLRVTGVADRQTLALLFGKRTPIPPVTIPDDISGNGGCKGLRFGDRGATVDLIQRQLKVLGYFEGKVDGKFRERTLYAVTRFQQDYNLVSDGCADTATLTAIDARLRAFAPNYPDAYWPDNQSSRPNYTNKQIVALQWQLQELDYYNGSIDGVFDEEVRDALIQFQEDHSLPATGRVDRNTQVTLNRLLAKESSSREITLRRGDRGPDVRQLQSWLKNAGKNPGPINGVFGAETEFAVLSFQQESNLSPATGIATPATLAALQNGLTRRPTISAMPISSNSNSRSSILQLQRRLQDLGFYNGSLNGVFDTPTRAALAQAQNSYGVNSDDLFSQTF